MEMALMSSREGPLQSLRSWGGLDLAGRKFWRTGAAFVAVYYALNLLTEWHEFDRLGITLWSPDDGLSVALLIESVAFAPFVFLGAALVDLSIVGIHRSIGVTMAELFLTITYVGLALILKNTLRFDLRQFRLPDVVAFLFLVPTGAALSAFIYCGVLYLGGVLSSTTVFAAMRQDWIGDALGIVTIIPAATAVFMYLSTPQRRWSGHILFTIFIFVVGMCLGFAALIGVGDRLHYLFNLLFLPVIWVAMREGYAGVALALPTPRPPAREAKPAETERHRPARRPAQGRAAGGVTT
jgi:integral membrane sensor domain MASE1